MSYDPTKDEPVYSHREVEQIVESMVDRVVRRTWELARQQTLRNLVRAPLSVHGRWEPDTVYDVNSLVLHNGRQWLAVAQTSGEPGRNDAWLYLSEVANLPPALSA